MHIGDQGGDTVNRKEIDIRDIRGIKIGQAEDVRAGTGCTVLLAEVMSEAILRAVTCAKSAYGFPAYGDIVEYMGKIQG